MMKEIIITFALLIFKIWATNCEEMDKQKTNFQVNNEMIRKLTVHVTRNSVKVKRAQPEDFAEKNADFIFSYVQTVWPNPTSYSVESPEEISKIPNQEKGLYIFFIEKDGTKYPIYVGVTSRNFRERFQDHQSRGVIKRIMTDQTFPQSALRPFNLKVMCLPLEDQMIAKLMESIFLASFDFCLNDSENEVLRLTIDTNGQFPVAESKKKFEGVFEKVINQIKHFYDSTKNMKMKGRSRSSRS